MTEHELHPGLAEAVDHLGRLRWSALAIDADLRLAWVSDELRQFLGGPTDEELGVGRPIRDVLANPAWLRTVHPDSLADFTRTWGSYLTEGATIDDLATVVSASFMYVDPEASDGPPEYRVDAFATVIGDRDGRIGTIVQFVVGMRPNLLVLLAKGDEEMYERMARLTEPGPREAAVLFCDLHASGALARRMPTAKYFRLVRELWTGIDRAVADHGGIVGKHAGDGASAFFLAGDLGGASGTAAAAIRTARRIHDVSAEVFETRLESECLVRVGLHWGANLYMGQLVPGGRLDVTALGDEVNEAARIEAAAPPGGTLASKQLLERLSADDAKDLGIDVEDTEYRLLADLLPGAVKAVRDAGTIAVAPV